MDGNDSFEFVCPPENVTFHDTVFGLRIAMVEWKAVLILIVLGTIIISTIIGNILVILSVFTHKPLRIVQNFFIVSLAVADITVAVLVMPLNVAYSLLGKWQFGKLICKLWLTCDVMCCTASISHLCVIGLDRYSAITDPINYAQKRTIRRVCWRILAVWIFSFIISGPPLLGWNDWPEHFTNDTPCKLSSRQGYVIFSSFGSFYLPLLMMALYYFKIYMATRRMFRKRVQICEIENGVGGVGGGCGGGGLGNATAVAGASGAATAAAVAAGNYYHNHYQFDNDSNSGDNISCAKIEKITKSKKKSKKLTIRYRNECSNQTQNELLAAQDDSEPASLARKSLSECGATRSADVAQCEPQQPQLQQPQPPPSQLVPGTSATAVHQFIEQKQKISLKKERRASRILGIVVGVFVLCWLPFFIMYVTLPFCPTCCPSDTLINFITWLGYANSALNPLIYTVFNVDFRNAFKKLLQCQNQN